MQQTMKLSEAIRLGAQKRAQNFGDYVQQFQVDENSVWGPYEYRTCAIGAAYEYITGKLPQPDWLQDGKVNKAIYKACGVRNVRIPYPDSVLPECKAYVVDVVSSLNDTHKWSREQIADYLESIGY